MIEEIHITYWSKKIAMRRSFLLLLCLVCIVSILQANDISKDTMRSSAVRIDGRRSVGGRMLHGTECISPMAEMENAKSKLTINDMTAIGWTVNAPRYDSTKIDDGWHRFNLKEGNVTAMVEMLVLNDSSIV
ncbi:MAG: hypothetical protein IKX48_05665, partial [Victivallales bacterium]|nr:hypothetical protein [Victivallales bacterium]